MDLSTEDQDLFRSAATCAIRAVELRCRINTWFLEEPRKTGCLAPHELAVPLLDGVAKPHAPLRFLRNIGQPKTALVRNRTAGDRNRNSYARVSKLIKLNGFQK